MQVSLPDLPAMAALGERIAHLLQPGDVVALEGDLGTGKTTLARAIIAALGHEGEVPSPSFTIVETYDHLSPPLVHADFYRLEHPSEADEIGLDDYREGAALIAEWPMQAGGFAHEPVCLAITLRFHDENGEGGRMAIVEPGQAWLGRWG
ncbi:tRNA (adenosine(37)-N6)-threonylcarbamoyltransferase complex ATPase subunit type 1 TsaE [Aurantiacibacter xanthus]|uniref:tRNA threonylcarbamoyladenosine biosynthesis protein TsaE n=1 Tax=Aurantiacibacter xanthus TaxID=1784712 RepID=A0A3A1PB72_9SPHN|nr:tRNA (adenosine(37)-N6)-threonylcarbamoyltransferase complex ATPase subunit type 1 TsaE [Aurantiacibacter xanthus]